MNTDTLSRQGVAATLRKAGFRISTEGRNGRIGYATQSEGFSVRDNGHTVYTCKMCGRSDTHRPGCKATGAARFWRQRKVKDGTVTVELHRRTSARLMDDDDRAAMDALAEQMVAHLTAEGLHVRAEGQHRWVVSPRNEEVAA